MPTESIAQAKATLRTSARVRRDAMPAPQRSMASQEICNQLRSLLPVGAVMAFVALGSEVDLSGLKPGVLPRVEGHDLVPVRVVAADELVRSRFGVLEPTGPGIDPAEIDAVVVPGLAFDRDGYRVGYGKGFYDRFLPQLRSDAMVIGVCFDVQVVDHVPHDHFDIAVPLLVTESGLLRS